MAAGLTVLADSGAWIDYLRSQKGALAARLDLAIETEVVMVGDLILAEVLRGLPDDRDAARVVASLETFEFVELGGAAVAQEAARMYRHMRAKGVTVRGTLDMLVGAWCCFNDVPLIHDDRDFKAMERWCGLKSWHALN